MCPEDEVPLDWKEARRKRALELRQMGWRLDEIAEALGVTKGAVSQWLARPDLPEAPAWRTHARAGRPPKLDKEHLEMIPDMLSHGAEAWGFCGDLWTAARVAAILRWQFGVEYHKGHVRKLLKRLGWSPQIPLQRAVQRDEAAIQRWRTQVFPQLKKKPGTRRGRSSSSMNRASP